MRKVPNVNTHIFKQPDLPWSLEIVSDEAQAMLDNYTLLGVTLTGIERSFMIAYVDDEVASGNHTLKDYETIYSLAGVNALVDYIGGKIAIAVNAPTFDINGANFDGSTNYIRSNFVPSTDGVNYTLDDSQVGVFVFDNVTPADFRYPFGVLDGAGTFLYFTSASGLGAGGGVRLPVNSGVVTIESFGLVSDNTLYNIARNSSTTQGIYADAVFTAANVNSGTVPTIEVYIGARNNEGTAGSNFIGIISSFMIGGDAGFNYTDYNTNLRALLTGLGLSI